MELLLRSGAVDYSTALSRRNNEISKVIPLVASKAQKATARAGLERDTRRSTLESYIY